jgi:energy-coupling factor transporter transmembrane protein EcfT
MSAGPGAAAPDGRPFRPHPALRILLLLVLAALLFRYSLAAIVLVLAILLGFAAAGGADKLSGILRSLRRIRWLLLSIAVIYLWVAPEPGVEGRPWYLPSWHDVDIALRRSGVLVVLVTAVELLRRYTPAPQMAAGLLQLLTPVGRVGMNSELLARRLALTLDAVPRVAERVARAAAAGHIRRGLAGWGEAAAELVRDIEAGTAGAPEDASLPRLGRPAVRDWLWFAAGAVACLAMAQL